MGALKLKKRSSRTLPARIHKLSGQLAAIERMVASKRTCRDVLAQVEAVRSGLESVAAILVNEELNRLNRHRSVDPQDVLSLIRTFIKQT